MKINARVLGWGFVVCVRCFDVEPVLAVREAMQFSLLGRVVCCCCIYFIFYGGRSAKAIHIYTGRRAVQLHRGHTSSVSAITS